MIHTVSREIAGKLFAFESGRLAKQAGGAVVAGVGDTIVLACATMARTPREGQGFFPLTCDYEERKYSVGKIPGGFIKRGGRPSDKAVLTSRLIDRPLRPLFPDGMRNDVQVIVTTLSTEADNPSDVVAVTAASAALCVSDIPFGGPIACVRVGLIQGEMIAFPSVEQINQSDLDLVLAGTKDQIVMVEAGAKWVPESVMLDAMELGQGVIRELCELQEELVALAGKPKAEVPLFLIDPTVLQTVRTECAADIQSALQNPDKLSRESALDDLKADIVEKMAERFEDESLQAQVGEAVDKLIKEAVRSSLLATGKRPDGRGPTDIRELSAEVGLLPRTHGSGLFTRGQTQVLTSVTLGPLDDAQIIDGLEEDTRKRYMHFYNFPPYSTGETRFMRGPGRREVGHGALAERALKPVIPDEESFPYAILLVSEVLESNGSSSMASVCGSTLALMDAGVKISAPVAGIAMGMISDSERRVILTDIQGIEDACGDMDFKVAGTRDGITALQLDAKIGGLTREDLAQALEQARQARMVILDCIVSTIPEPRESLSQYAPRIFIMEIDPSKIGEVIGPGGRVIQKICALSGAEIDIEQTGKVYIAAPTFEGGELAQKMIRDLTQEAVIGSEYDGVVTRFTGRGAFVEFLPGREGLVPVDKLVRWRIRRPEEVVQIGDSIRVKIDEVDNLGRLNLTALGLPQTLESLDEANRPVGAQAERSGGGGGSYGRGPSDRGPRAGGDGPRPNRGGPSRGGGERGGDRGHGPGDRGPARGDKPQGNDRGPRQDDGPQARFRPRR
ncbi:MAG: polyribonucleotide nucleotidyltransferase [Fimbriimonadia bacterium]|jgi:polyribonucleotide nucleotidyltransferase